MLRKWTKTLIPSTDPTDREKYEHTSFLPDPLNRDKYSGHSLVFKMERRYNLRILLEQMD
jgi:hypothetical protein